MTAWVHEAIRVYGDVVRATGRAPRRFHLDERQADELEAITGRRDLLLGVDVVVKP